MTVAHSPLIRILLSLVFVDAVFLPVACHFGVHPYDLFARYVV